MSAHADSAVDAIKAYYEKWSATAELAVVLNALDGCIIVGFAAEDGEAGPGGDYLVVHESDLPVDLSTALHRHLMELPRSRRWSARPLPESEKP